MHCAFRAGKPGIRTHAGLPVIEKCRHLQTCRGVTTFARDIYLLSTRRKSRAALFVLGPNIEDGRRKEDVWRSGVPFV
jgi:hypothetical protein